MKIVLATGIYPPDIGGPATYSYHLAQELHARGHKAIVVSYEPLYGRTRRHDEPWTIIDVSRKGNAFSRWLRFSNALRTHASGADIVYGFSSISIGVPMKMARLKKPKTILRIGGDFFWERYTDEGGMKGLREWYASRNATRLFTEPFFHSVLHSFDALVFSTHFQQDIYMKHFRRLPPHIVIENATPHAELIHHAQHTPFKILFMGRFVGFKNLPALVHAIRAIPDATLTITGEGPVSLKLIDMVSDLHLNQRVTFISPVHGDEKKRLLLEHDVLVIPSVTEISPNVALEARSMGLPVLLSSETGLSDALRSGMSVRPLRTPQQIQEGILDIKEHYAAYAADAAKPFASRDWPVITDEHLHFFSTL